MVTREIYWAIPGHEWLYLPAAVATAVFLYGMWARLRLVRRGAGGHVGLGGASGRVGPSQGALLQRRFWIDLYAGVMHLLILWGMLVWLLARSWC